MSAIGYRIEWLQHRYEYDAEARWALPLLQWIEQYPRKIYRIVDLGAGLGSNLRFWSKRINGAQDWTLVEIDESLIAQGSIWLEHLPDGVSARYMHKDFLTYLRQQPPPDLLLCNALLDVLTARQVVDLLDYVWANDLPLMSSINYSGMEFFPGLPEDQRFIAAYEAHMEREQSTGYALGRSLEPLLATISGPYDVAMHASPWKVPAKDARMLTFLLDYMEQAVPEIISLEDLPSFRRWLQVRRHQVREGQLHAMVLHQDAWIRRAEKKFW
ncbi:MAG TPA: hypothetical protein PK643_03005 [Saprospiraceae bacterium]|nr:hypothetical protein [Saprospiraceae bacterium]